MTRVLIFDGPRAAKRFELLWAALQAGGDGKGDRMPVTIRKEARLLDLLDGISVDVASNGNPVPMRQLIDATTLTVAQEDFELLQTYCEKTPWTPRISREVVDLLDWLSTAEKDT